MHCSKNFAKAKFWQTIPFPSLSVPCFFFCLYHPFLFSFAISFPTFLAYYSSLIFFPHAFYSQGDTSLSSGDSDIGVDDDEDIIDDDDIDDIKDGGSGSQDGESLNDSDDNF